MWWLFFVGLGVVLVEAVAYWLVRRGAAVSKTFTFATAVSAALMLFPLAGMVLLIAWALGWFWAIAALVGFFLFQYLMGPRLVLNRSYVRLPTWDEAWLVETFREVKQAAGFNKRVELYIARDPFPNAFAVSNAFRRAVVVNEGLLKLVGVGVLDKEDVKAILAHELGHIVHRDNTYAIAASMAPYMTYVVGFGAFIVGVTWTKLAFEEGDNILPGIALSVFGGALLLLSFLVNVGVLGFLRMREHLADLFSVKVTRSTKIAEALVKMEAALEALGVERRRNSIKPDARKMLYILPMAYGELFGFVSYLFLTRPLSSHPSTEARYYVVEKYYQQL